MKNKEENQEETELEDLLEEEPEELEIKKDEKAPVDFSSSGKVKKSLKKIKPIDVDTFEEFFDTTPKSTAPVLDQVEQAQEVITLEQGVEAGPAPATSTNSDDPFKYDIGSKREEKQTYIASSSHMTSETTRFDPTKIGREKPQTPEVGFIHSEGKQNSLNTERYTVPDRVDTRELGKENSFQAREIEGKKMDYEPLH